MTLRKLSCWFGLALIVTSQWAMALGLGEIKLNSALNEPLDAEIRLLNVGDLGATEILAGLASEEDFNRAGVERAFHLVDMRFKVDVSNSAAPVIRITSRKPIREPYLDFLLDVQWSSGRLLREYTVLLDLPVYATDKPVGKSLAAAQSASRQPTRQPSNDRTTTAVSSASPNVNISGDYQVQSGDTLWQIANRARPGNATVQQAVIAIHRLNPEAFIDGNINLLRKGAVLRMPDGSEFGATDHRQAVQIVAAQTREWRDSGPQLDASSRSGVSGVRAASGDGRLRLSALGTADEEASDSAAAVGGESSLVGAGSVEALQNEVAIAQEEADKMRRENSELKARLANLEEQLKLDRLVEIGDDELRAAQLAAGVDATAADDNGDGVQPSAVEESITGEAAQGSEPVPEPAAEEGESSRDESTPPVGDQTVQTEVVKDGFFAAIKGYLLVIAGVVGFVVLGVSYLVYRQRHADQDDHLDSADFGQRVDPLPSRARSESAARTVEEAPDITSLDEIDLDEEDLLFTPESDADTADEQFVGEEKVDPLGEADIYLSLGNYEEAEAVLNRALETAPDDGKLHLKMLELFTVQEDLERFDAYYPNIRRLNEPGLAVEAAKLRAELAGDAAPAASLDASLQEPDDAAEFEFSLDEESLAGDLDLEGEERPEELADGEQLADEDFDIELDLESELADIQLDKALDDIDDSVDGAQEATVTAQRMAPEALTAGGEPPVADSDPTTDAFDLDSDFDLLDSGDESSTQLELAQAYIDMGDPEGAREILEEVVERGTAEQQEKARSLINSLA